MSVRIGRISRHEDVHGVSGTGNHMADVFEASDGTCIVRWLGTNGSTNVYASVKNVTNVHGHGGKTEIEWLWEQEPDQDPMDAIIDKKIEEAGGKVNKEPTSKKISVEEVEGNAAEVERVSEQVAEKVAEKLVKKLSKTKD